MDELEKAFVGMTGKNASEVSSRLLGYFLTWLQEKTKPVFIMATANDITALPPELLRKGRFDEIFYVGFPNQAERKKILEIHLSKAKQTPSEFNLTELAQLCRDYSGADIENAVYESVKTAFLSTDQQLTQERIKHAIKNTVPLRKTLKDKVGEYEKKFEKLYLTPASKNDGLSIPQMKKMAEDPNYLERKKVAEDAEVTEDILELLVKDKELDVRKAAFANPNCPTKLLDEQIQLKEDDQAYDEEILEIIVKHNNISFPLAVKICKDTSTYIDELVKNADLTLEENQNALLENNYTQNILLKQAFIYPACQLFLADKLSWSERRTLASHLQLTEEVQLKLAQDSDSDVRKSLAENVNLTEQVQLKLAGDSDAYSVRDSLAKNVNITEKVQLFLASYGKEVPSLFLWGDSLQSVLAKNINITEQVQLKLAEDSYYRVRRSLAENANLIEHIQLKLAEDSDDTVRRSLAENANLTEQVQLKLVEDSDYNVRSGLAKNVNITEQIQLKLAEDSRSDVRNYLAENPNIIAEVQLILIGDLGIYNINHLAKNKNLCAQVQQLILDDARRIYVVKSLRNNPSVLPEIKEMIDSREYICATEIYKNSNGDEDNVAIKEFFVKEGDKVTKGELLLEHWYYAEDYNTREIKSPCDGVVEKILRKVGSDDKDNSNSIIMIIKKDKGSESHNFNAKDFVETVAAKVATLANVSKLWD